MAVRVISSVLDMGESPESTMVETIIHAVDQYQSEASGADISFKMGAKARTGGTVGRAPIGYLNRRDVSEGRNIGMVQIDPDRAPLVRQAFELYATNDYTISNLAEELEHLGLQTVPGRYPSRALSTSQLQAMLQNRYYLGYVIFKGEEIKGRHDAIVDPELFDNVQAVMDSRGRNHVRKRTHDHYLKGALWCYECHLRGHEFRLIRQQSKGSGGTYDYFFCRGRQEHVCDSRYMSTDEVETAIEAFYARIRFPKKFIDSVRQKVTDVVLDSEHSTTLRRQQIERELKHLNKKEGNLLDLVADGQLPGSKVRSRISDLNEQQARLTQQLESLEDRLEAGAELISEALELLDRSQDLYRKFSNSQRYLLNRALFKKLYIRDGHVVSAEFNEPFDEMISAHDELAGTPTFPDLTPVVLAACET